MSWVLLLAADKPLPLCDRQEVRSRTAGTGKNAITIALPCGFLVAEHSYYRPAVEALGYAMKSYQYELSLELEARDLQQLRAYLQQQFSPGERLELWHISVSDADQGRRPVRYTGELKDFDMDTLEQLLTANRRAEQCQMIITV